MVDRSQTLPSLSNSWQRTAFSRIDEIFSNIVFVITLIFVAVPLGYLFFGSFRSDAPGMADAHFTLANWIAVYTTARYQTAFLDTVLLSTVAGMLAVAMGSILAWIVARTNVPGRGPLAVSMVVPLMISPLVTALAWIALAAPNAGFMNAWIKATVGVGPVVDIYSFWGIVWVMALHFASFAFIAVYSALLTIDGAVEEACHMSGAGPIRTAVKITLPLVWPSMATSFLLIFIFVSENFSVPTLLGASVGFHTLSSAIYYDMLAQPAQPTEGAAAGAMLIWIALFGTLWQRRIMVQSRRYATISGKVGRHRVNDLGAWRLAAMLVVCLYLLLAVALPYFALVLASLLKFVTPRLTPTLFTLDNYATILTSDDGNALRNSLGLSLFGGLGATLLYVSLAYLIKYSRSWLSRVTDYIVILPTVLPALVLGVGFVWAFVAIPAPIYGTIWALVIAYMVRYVGMGVRQSRAAFVQVGEELSEAAQMCGARSLQSIRYVLLPLLRPALVSLWTTLFIFIFMEISMTMLLYGPDSTTLPVLLWSRMSQGYQTEAFAIAVVQATIVLVLLLISNRLFGTLRSVLDN